MHFTIERLFYEENREMFQVPGKAPERDELKHQERGDEIKRQEREYEIKRQERENEIKHQEREDELEKLKDRSLDDE
ncbi:hypothetical protein TNCV_1180951 [Trichonephila clavipes]|nr:hypothetical protein TNCV_1180951 [Trichonephila clavipes]